MSKMSKKLRLWLYSNNLRDFMNNDVKIKRNGRRYLFVSKKQDYVFRDIMVDPGDYLSPIQQYQVADCIFAEISNLRKTDNEAF